MLQKRANGFVFEEKEKSLLVGCQIFLSPSNRVFYSVTNITTQEFPEIPGISMKNKINDIVLRVLQSEALYNAVFSSNTKPIPLLVLHASSPLTI